MLAKKITNRAFMLAKFGATFFALGSSVAHAGYVENATVVKVRTPSSTLHSFLLVLRF
jgi:hypothetical protein